MTVTTLFQHPTARALARVLGGGDDAPAWTSLVPMGSGAGAPLFAVHGQGGQVGLFLGLARRLDGAHPVVGVQAVEHAGGEPPPSFEAAATHYAREIRAYRPEGPLAIIGSSMGGMLAFEVVRQLRAAGADARLFVVDTVPVNLPRRVELRAVAGHLRARVRHHARAVASRPHGLVRHLRDPVRRLRDLLRKRPATAATAGPPGAGHYRALLDHYVPRPTPMPVTVFAATDRGVERDLGLAWQYLAVGPPEVVPIEGDHFILRREAGCEAVAAGLRPRLGAL